MDNMRVAKLIAPMKIELTISDTEIDPGFGEASIKIKAVGICGTDIHMFRGDRPDVNLPRIMGHELSGEVISIGMGVKHLKLGDRVVLDPVMACGICETCLKGRENVCASVKCFGVQMDGGYRDIVTVPARQLYKIPDNISYSEAALVEPFSIAANILNRAKAVAGETLVIIGAGTIGLALLQAAKGIGVRVLVSDIVDVKLDKARAFGAEIIINTSSENLYDKVALFAPNGPDIIVDAVGTAKLLETSISLCGPLSRVVVISFDNNAASISPINITKKELTIVGSRMNAHRFDEVLSWFKLGTVKPSMLVDQVFTIENIQQAFDTVVSNTNLTKVLISFD